MGQTLNQRTFPFTFLAETFPDAAESPLCLPKPALIIRHVAVLGLRRCCIKAPGLLIPRSTLRDEAALWCCKPLAEDPAQHDHVSARSRQ